MSNDETNDLYKPQLFDATNELARASFEKLCLSQEQIGKTVSLVDDLHEEWKELALLRDPSLLAQGTNAIPPAAPSAQDGVWVYYPWKNIAVRVLHQNDFAKLRLSRNHDLITQEEQGKVAHATIAVAGLNVGNSGAICLAQEGVGSVFRMADNDILSLSNLNRFRAGLADLLVNKAVLSARQAYEVNPYLTIDVTKDGLSKDNLDAFLDNADVLIEEMDNLPLKIAIRELARAKRIPVVMVTGSGHDIVLDVERFDLEPELPLLSGMLKENIISQIKAGPPKTLDEKLTLARDFMGSAYLTPRLVDSFDKVGKTLIGIPQLAEATFLRGAALAHTTKEILLGNDVPSGRYMFGLSQLYSKKCADNEK